MQLCIPQRAAFQRLTGTGVKSSQAITAPDPQQTQTQANSNKKESSLSHLVAAEVVVISSESTKHAVTAF